MSAPRYRFNARSVWLQLGLLLATCVLLFLCALAMAAVASPVITIKPSSSNWAVIACGHAHCLALKADLGRLARAGDLCAGRASTPALRVVLVWEGGSITLGAHLPASSAYPALCGDALSGSYSVTSYVLAHKTKSIPEMLAQASVDASYAEPRASNIAVVMAGGHDLAELAGSPDWPRKGADRLLSGLAARLRSYCEVMRAAGFRIVLLTILPRDVPGEIHYERLRGRWNGWLREQGPPLVDAICDLAADKRIGLAECCHDGTYYSTDCRHPNAAGHAVIAELLLPVLERTLPVPDRRLP